MVFLHVRALLECHAQRNHCSQPLLWRASVVSGASEFRIGEFLATVTAVIVIIVANQDLTSSRLLPGIKAYAAYRYGRRGCELPGHRASKAVLNAVLMAWMIGERQA
jgi:hypothetical protein